MARPKAGAAVMPRGGGIHLLEGFEQAGCCLSSGMPMPVSRTEKCRSHCSGWRMKIGIVFLARLE